VEDVKKQNVACKYAFPKEGFTAWFHGVAIRKDTPKLPAALDYVNFCLEGWWGAQVATQGYYSPSATADVYLRTYRTSKSYNDYQWWYEGGSSGVAAVTRVTNSGSNSAMPSALSAIWPGAIAFTVTSGASSTASCCVSTIIALFARA
jgi:hypothetical protein